MTLATKIDNQAAFVGGHHSYGRFSPDTQNHQWASLLFQRVSQKARFNKVISWLLGRENRLWHLHPATLLHQVRARQTEKVSLAQIKGSTSIRHQDFDNQFRPLQNHTQARWISVANSYRELPLVDLIQVDSVYFVVDGHHRLSVANALGETEITANVTIFTVVQPQ
jgi:hypothetical protein